MPICPVERGIVLGPIDIGVKLGQPIGKECINKIGGDFILEVNQSDKYGPVAGRLAKIVAGDSIEMGVFNEIDREGIYIKETTLTGPAINKDWKVRRKLRFI